MSEGANVWPPLIMHALRNEDLRCSQALPLKWQTYTAPFPPENVHLCRFMKIWSRMTSKTYRIRSV